MKVLLSYPPDSLTRGWGVWPSYLEYLICLGSFLKHNGVEVIFFHEHPYSITYLSKLIEEEQPDIIYFKSDAANFDSCSKLTAIAKRISPHALTVWEGLLATFFDTKILEQVPHLDMIVRGETELTLQEVVDILRKNPYDSCFESVLGITYRDDGQIRRNQNRTVIKDLDTLPFLSYELYDKYKTTMTRFPRGCVIITGRGCPFSCRFCPSSMGYRYKSPERIIEEIKYYRDNYPQCLPQFLFSEKTFTVNKARTRKLCKLMIQENLKIDWVCGTRVDCVDDDLLVLMKKSGCKRISYGVESLSDTILFLMKKNFTSVKAMETLRKTHAHGIATHFNILLGFPGETEKTLRETLVHINQLDLEIICRAVSFFRLVPGSDIYNEVKEKGLVDDDMWFKGYDTYRFFTSYHTPAYVEKLKACRNAILHRNKDVIMIPNYGALTKDEARLIFHKTS